MRQIKLTLSYRVNGLVHKLLNDLKKYAGRMIMQPDAYTFRKRFIMALRKPLQNEVLKRGFNAEFSTIEHLYETARMLEEATQYHHGMHRSENMQSMSSQPYKSVTYRSASPVTASSRPVPQIRVPLTLPAHSQTVSVLRPEPRTTGSGPNPNNYPQWGNNTYEPPANAGGNRANNIGSNVVCYECGQPGHMHPNCPRLKGNVRATAVRHEATLPTVGDPSSGPPPMEEEQEGVEDDLQ
jgi:Zinc knuckle